MRALARAFNWLQARPRTGYRPPNTETEVRRTGMRQNEKLVFVSGMLQKTSAGAFTVLW